ncbi:hypothetical protein H8356DRAFT_1421080 [Neocallimastix lanati (nom. inval.)]|nr:hypothetical protein H8356DRAFT_1421080 [Neocallimastix sp. JGI-2020a]
MTIKTLHCLYKHKAHIANLANNGAVYISCNCFSFDGNSKRSIKIETDEDQISTDNNNNDDDNKNICDNSNNSNNNNHDTCIKYHLIFICNKSK